MESTCSGAESRVSLGYMWTTQTSPPQQVAVVQLFKNQCNLEQGWSIVLILYSKSLLELYVVPQIYSVNILCDSHYQCRTLFWLSGRSFSSIWMREIARLEHDIFSFAPGLPFSSLDYHPNWWVQNKVIEKIF